MKDDPRKIKVAWKNLLKERCPKCECVLNFDASRKLYVCALNDGGKGFFSCDFTCTEKTMAYVKKYGIKDIEMGEIDDDEFNGGNAVCVR